MMHINFAALVQQISVLALPAIFAITFHEAAHGFVAWRCGDDTARRAGRVTFNPARHIDPVGTILMPLLLFLGSNGQFLFGYAKPVPVDYNRLRHPRRDMVWVALAGPGTNLMLAVVSALLFYALPFVPKAGELWLYNTLISSIRINVLLALFNMIPIPPLDGGRVAVGLLPDVLALPLVRLERYGMLILLALIFVIPMIGVQMGMDLNLVSHAIRQPEAWLIDGILWATGMGA